MGKVPGFLHAAGHYKACTKGDEIGYTALSCRLSSGSPTALQRLSNGFPTALCVRYTAESCPTEGSELWNFHKVSRSVG